MLTPFWLKLEILFRLLLFELPFRLIDGVEIELPFEPDVFELEFWLFPIKLFIEFDEFDEFVKEGKEGLIKTFLDGSSSTNNTIFLAMTNYIERIPDSIKNRPSRFKYQIEIEEVSNSEND